MAGFDGGQQGNGNDIERRAAGRMQSSSFVFGFNDDRDKVLALTRRGEGAQALDAPADKLRDWQENTNSIFSAARERLGQQMEVWANRV